MRTRAMTPYPELTRDEIEKVRQVMGASHCLTCKTRFAVFMNAFAQALRLGVHVGVAGVGELLVIVEEEKQKGHDKGR